MSPEPPEEGPPLDAIASVFRVYEVEVEADSGEIHYYGDPLARAGEIRRELWPVFREQGFELRVEYRLGEWMLVAEPIRLENDGIPWTNVALLVATVLTTLWAGAQWYWVEDLFSAEIVRALPFMLAIMGVLGIHELGHYVMSRYHKVDASLPYFIPVPTFIGTLGAVIKMRGQIPSRKALFDIGVAGPLAGLVATVIVTVIGLYLPPVVVPEGGLTDPNAVQIQLGFPPLLEFLSWATGQPLTYDEPGKSVNPVVIAGWVGMFVTFLNILPVGQLDGGHILRATVGERQESIAALVPGVLFGLAGYLYYFRDVPADAAMIWAFWGVLALVFSYIGPANPIYEVELDRKRKVLAVVTFVLGILCFTPVPIQIVG